MIFQSEREKDALIDISSSLSVERWAIETPFQLLGALAESRTAFDGFGVDAWETMSFLYYALEDHIKDIFKSIDNLEKMVYCKVLPPAPAAHTKEVELGRNEEHGIAWGYDEDNEPTDPDEDPDEDPKAPDENPPNIRCTNGGTPK